jgi:glycosyltransferase involved in cell wall biosynthesis
MKLALITDYWIDSDGGGVREYTKRFVASLKKKIDITVLFREGIDPQNYKLPFNKIKFALKARKILSCENPDIILSQGGWYSLLPALWYKRKNKNVKVFFLFHTHNNHALPFYKRYFFNAMLNRCDMVGFVSISLKKNVEEIQKLKITKPTCILYAGAEIPSISNEEIRIFKASYGLRENKIYILGQALTASFEKKEGAKLLIQALKQVRKKHPEINLILTRKGLFFEELKEFARKEGMQDNVVFTGDIQNPIAAIAASYLLVQIPWGETLSLSMLEAMAFGKPIVAVSKNSEFSEAVIHRKNGLLVEYKLESIVNAILELVENPSLAEELGKTAKSLAEIKFRWDNTADLFLKLCRTL